MLGQAAASAMAVNVGLAMLIDICLIPIRLLLPRRTRGRGHSRPGEEWTVTPATRAFRTYPDACPCWRSTVMDGLTGGAYNERNSSGEERHAPADDTGLPPVLC